MSHHYVLFSVFRTFLHYFVVCVRKREKGTHPHFDVPVSPYLPLGRRNSSDPVASASAPANELAKQLPASASSLAVPPPAVSTAEAVDL